MGLLVGSNASDSLKRISSNRRNEVGSSSPSSSKNTQSSAPSTTSSSNSGSNIIVRNAPVYDSAGNIVGHINLTQNQVNALWENNPALARKMGVPAATGPGTSTPSTESTNTQSGAETISEGVNDEEKIKSNLEDVADALVSSGKTINPNINFDDISIEQFLAEADKTIAPEFKQKFDVAVQDLNTTLGRLGYDLEQKIGDIQRSADKVRLQGRETLAGRGTAFSSDRGRFEQDVTDAESRDEARNRELTFRSGQDALAATERYLGTEGIKSANPNTSLAGRQLSFSGKPLVGGLQSERQFAKESIGRQLQNDEYQRRAFTISSLGFQ